MIYLDYSANTPVDPLVLERFVATERAFCGNPNSAHAEGQRAREAYAQAVASIASLLGAQPGEIILTSGASESNNLAVKGIARASRHVGRHIVSTALEHPSVSACLTALQEQGYEIDLADIRRDGTVDTDHLRELLRRDTVLVAVGAVDSELGAVQPIGEIADILKDFPQCHLHVDATQAVGKIPFAFEHADTMTLAPHKFYGLNGCGILIRRKGLALEPLIHGGTGATLYRSGTPTLALACAAETALSLAVTNLKARQAVVRERHAQLMAALSRRPFVRLNSPAGAVPHIVNLSVPGARGEEMQKALSRRGVCVSVKSACSTPGTPSKAVFAVSRDRKTALSSLRVSLSHLTTAREIDEFIDIFDTCLKELIP